MSWFQLDPESLAARARGAGATVPTLGSSLLRGMLGFTVVSVAGFVPWAVMGQRWFGGELGMYIACAVVFIGLTSPLLHRLIIGPGSLVRFYKVFAPAFAVYSVAWIAGWMLVRGHAGSVVGLLAGTAIMGSMLAAAFDAWAQVVKVIPALFVLNAAGYFIGGVVEGALIQHHKVAAMLMWGVLYGLGLGAGLGLAFYFCQTKARALLGR